MKITAPSYTCRHWLTLQGCEEKNLSSSVEKYRIREHFHGWACLRPLPSRQHKADAGCSVRNRTIPCLLAVANPLTINLTGIRTDIFPIKATLWSWTNWKIWNFFSLGSRNKIYKISLFLIFKKIKKSRKTVGLIEVEFKSKWSAWAEGIEPLPWVPASVERVAAASLLALCIQGIFSVVKLFSHF